MMAFDCNTSPAEQLGFVGVDRYLELLKDSKIKGYLFQQSNYIERTNGVVMDVPSADDLKSVRS